VSAEAARLLAHARRQLADADKMLSVDLAHSAARESYMALFNAARALLLSQTGERYKKHGMVHAACRKLAASDPELGNEVGRQLASLYPLKLASDYASETAPTLAEAREILDGVERTIARIATLLARP